MMSLLLLLENLLVDAAKSLLPCNRMLPAKFLVANNRIVQIKSNFLARLDFRHGLMWNNVTNDYFCHSAGEHANACFSGSEFRIPNRIYYVLFTAKDYTGGSSGPPFRSELHRKRKEKRLNFI
jgi:hypothetical protein